jgi:murein DD-endopeptidase MepM/ murein hydrolase activator NlpD
MQKIRTGIKKLFVPVTIMFIPHNSRRAFNLKFPTVGLIALAIFSLIGMGVVALLSVSALEYQVMKQKVNFYSSQFQELHRTMEALKKSEEEFRKIFSFKKKEDVFKNMDTLQKQDNGDSGSIDIELLKPEIASSMARVKEIKEYLVAQKDIYESTPRGLPANGYITSGYGYRTHPIKKVVDFHSGLDIMTDQGDPVRATANGVVSFAGPSGANGNLVVVEHGHGYSTVYAHNEMVLVHAGQVVKRGEVIARVGSTGLSTGPHVHYEIWKDQRAINPGPFASN